MKLELGSMGTRNPTLGSVFSLSTLGVAVVLLVIQFAITPIVCGHGPNISLAWANSAQYLPGSESDLQVFVKDDGSVYVGAMFVEGNTLAFEFSRLSHIASDRIVVIQADRKASFATIRLVLASARDAGFSKFKLVTFEGPAPELWARKRAV